MDFSLAKKRAPSEIAVKETLEKYINSVEKHEKPGEYKILDLKKLNIYKDRGILFEELYFKKKKTGVGRCVECSKSQVGFNRRTKILWELYDKTSNYKAQNYKRHVERFHETRAMIPRASGVHGQKIIVFNETPLSPVFINRLRQNQLKS